MLALVFKKKHWVTSHILLSLWISCTHGNVFDNFAYPWLIQTHIRNFELHGNPYHTVFSLNYISWCVCLVEKHLFVHVKMIFLIASHLHFNVASRCSFFICNISTIFEYMGTCLRFKLDYGCLVPSMAFSSPTFSYISYQYVKFNDWIPVFLHHHVRICI